MTAQKIVNWNLKHPLEGNLYPFHYWLNIYALNLGVFFLLAQARLSLCRSQAAHAIVQTRYHNLHHISFWEISVSNFPLLEIEEFLKCWDKCAGWVG